VDFYYSAQMKFIDLFELVVFSTNAICGLQTLIARVLIAVLLFFFCFVLLAYYLFVPLSCYRWLVFSIIFYV